ncbi:protein kinase [Sorangium sp. So ce134]
MNPEEKRPADGAHIRPGCIIAGRYVVEHLIGEGAFSWVFRATDIGTKTRSPVAVKVIRPEHAGVDAVVRRLKLRELKLLRQLHETSHAVNIVRAVEPEIITHKGLLCLVLELIDGPSLEETLAEQRILELSEIIRISTGIARGLSAIHAAQAVHRDLKPSNVRLRNGIVPVIVDLGIAKALWETQALTGDTQALMTPRYAAPEQLARECVLPASDVYALGLMIYEMLVGNVPLIGSSYAETLRIRSWVRPIDPRALDKTIPEPIALLTLRCLSTDPYQRPRADEIAQTLSIPSIRRRRAILGAAAFLTMAIAPTLISRLRRGSHGPKAAPNDSNRLAEHIVETAGADDPPASSAPRTAPPVMITKAPGDGVPGSSGASRANRGARPSTTWRHPPIKLPIDGPITHFGAGHIAVAMTADRSIWAWDNTYDGQLWRGVEPYKVNCTVLPVAVVAGTNFPLIIDSGGSVWTWRRRGERTQPVSSLSGVAAAAAGHAYIVALMKDSSVWLIGGVGSMDAAPDPIMINEPSRVKMIAAGGHDRSAVLSEDGKVWSWRHSTSPQSFGTMLRMFPSETRVTAHQIVDFPRATAIAINNHQTLALDEEGNVWSWWPSHKATIKLWKSVHFTAIASCTESVLAIDKQGGVWAWGKFVFEYPKELYIDAPTRVQGLPPIVAVSTNGHYSLAQDEHGSLWAWGTTDRCDDRDAATRKSLGCHE